MKWVYLSRYLLDSTTCLGAQVGSYWCVYLCMLDKAVMRFAGVEHVSLPFVEQYRVSLPLRFYPWKSQVPYTDRFTTLF